jgi:hypothetical protein
LEQRARRSAGPGGGVDEFVFILFGKTAAEEAVEQVGQKPREPNSPRLWSVLVTISLVITL